MLKDITATNAHERALYLATLALGQHARNYFPGLCPPKWRFWESQHVRIEWHHREMRHHEGDRLPVVHLPGDYIEVAGSMRIGNGILHNVKVRVDFYPYRGTNPFADEMKVEVIFVQDGDLPRSHASYYQKDLLPATSAATGLVIPV